MWTLSAVLAAGALGCDEEGGPTHDADPAHKDAGSRDAAKRRDANDDPNACEKLALPSAAMSPQVLIVQDRSGSMVGLGDIRNLGRNRWRPSVSALEKLTSELSETVEFGLMLFPSPGGGPAGIGPGCEPGKLDVEPSLGNAEQIAKALARAYPDVGATPTAATLMYAKEALDTGACADCSDVPKYVLLVTDGQPTCGDRGLTSSTPEDIAATNSAIDALSAVGIKTYVIGYDTASDPKAASAMDSFAMHGGTDHHLPVEDEASLLGELTRIAGALVPCEFTLSQDVEDASFVRVQIDGVSYEYEKDWKLDGRTVVLEGNACPTLRDAKRHVLKITRECERVILL